MTMKWKNKGNELNERATKIISAYKKVKGIYVFGAGFLGEEMRAILGEYGIFRGYIDNDIDKQKNGYNGADVISFMTYYRRPEETWIVVAASDKNTREILNQLNAAGLYEGKDFFPYRQFINEVFPIVSFYYYKKLFAQLAQICLTERCTLKCRKCAHACYNVPNSTEDPALDYIKESADCFFSKFDVVREFVLIGGEPFLYKDIKEVIAYIGEKYRDKIILFAITTNGTILPDDEIIDLCKRYDVTIRVSDYSASIPRLSLQYEKLYEKLSENKVIAWKTDCEESWFDYGFEEVDRGSEEKALIVAFDECRTPCREISGSKYYYCVMARSVAANLGIEAGKTDYIDLTEIEDRRILLEFQMGFSNKGYLDMCRYCRGAEAKNHRIPAAEQI